MFVPSVPPGINTLGLPPGSQLFNPMGMPEQPAPAPSQPGPPEADFDRSINYYADYSGCGHWRMIWPEHVINAHQKAVIHGTTMMVLDERYYQGVQTVRLQRQATEQQLKFVELLKEFSKKYGFRIVYEIDDIVFHEDIPEYNKFKPAFANETIRKTALRIMQEVDEITVTNKFMKDYYESKTGHKNITVIPNYPPKWWIGNFYSQEKVNHNYNNNKKKPRVLYAASGAHFDVDNRVNQQDDFEYVRDVIAKTVDDIHWVFIGAFPPPLAPLVREGKIEFHNWKRLYEYPSLINALNVNMMIAPLQDNNFNKAKSDLKYIEACCYGLPIACQDLCTYEEAPIKFKTGDDMIDQIKKTVKYEDKYMKISDNARRVADTRWLELDENIDKYQELYKLPYNHPERKLLNSLAANK